MFLNKIKEKIDYFLVNCKYVFYKTIIPVLKSIKTSIGIVVQNVIKIYNDIKQLFLIKSTFKKAQKLDELERKKLVAYNVLEEIKKIL